jgi:hypothetical protein
MNQATMRNQKRKELKDKKFIIEFNKSKSTLSALDWRENLIQILIFFLHLTI